MHAQAIIEGFLASSQRRVTLIVHLKVAMILPYVVGYFQRFEWSALGCFALNIGFSFLFHVEFIGVMTSIEIVYSRDIKHLWLESDS